MVSRNIWRFLFWVFQTKENETEREGGVGSVYELFDRLQGTALHRCTAIGPPLFTTTALSSTDLA